MIVFGRTELLYLKAQSPAKARTILDGLFHQPLAGLVVIESRRVPKYFAPAADAGKIPLFVSPLDQDAFFDEINRYLTGHLSEGTSLHGVLMDINGVGVLLQGESGIGKSETALDLIMRGHRLVADDIVEIQKVPPDALLGIASELIRHHMELRGLGIINIRDLFGIASIRHQKRIELVCQLIDWKENEDYDRLGLEDETCDILSVPVPCVRIPVRPGRNLAVIIEIAARNQLLKIMGHHSAREFQKRLTDRINLNERRRATDGREHE